ncbi:VOC family protein [Halomarina oriensis]|uniref:VOC family protein n=1 Tax=Halomarina oriensis TaxID=671145 RepID=A0A6B0GRN9_9EURY|nr:VOC family protein [Halomarina oriensis]MWG36801.1 VOC family protein [Halomarina oriensis]
MPTSLPAESRIGRVALRVADLDRVAAFYESVVGLARLDESPDHVSLGAGGARLLELHARPDLPERGPDETGLFHTAFLLPDRASLGDALSRVEGRSRLTGASDHRVSEALYLDDPEGNGVELYRDRPRDEWPTVDGRVRMDTLPLDLDALRTEAAGENDAPPETTVGHVHLEVSSIPDARAFYVDTLGANLRQEWNGAAFAAAGEYHHHVGLNTWNGRERPGTGRGLDRFELLVPGDGALSALHDRFDADAVAVESSDEGLTVRDPDGITLRVRVDD